MYHDQKKIEGLGTWPQFFFVSWKLWQKTFHVHISWTKPLFIKIYARCDVIGQFQLCKKKRLWSLTRKVSQIGGILHKIDVWFIFTSLFVGGSMSYLRYLCLFAYSGVQHILSQFVFCFCFVFLCLVYPMLPVSLTFIYTTYWRCDCWDRWGWGCWHSRRRRKGLNRSHWIWCWCRWGSIYYSSVDKLWWYNWNCPCHRSWWRSE
jgi:hypothetical protein